MLATCYVLMGVSLTFTFMLIILFCTVMVKYMSVCLYVCLSDSDMVLTAQTARLLIDCVACRKQRVSYYRRRLLEPQKTMFAVLQSEFDYTCGSPTNSTTSCLAWPCCCKNGTNGPGKTSLLLLRRRWGGN